MGGGGFSHKDTHMAAVSIETPTFKSEKDVSKWWLTAHLKKKNTHIGLHRCGSEVVR